MEFLDSLKYIGGMENMGFPGTDRLYTYRDYLSWPDDLRVELIHGRIFDMSAAPNLTHQSILLEIGRQIANFLLDNDEWKVFVAPFDVRIPSSGLEDEDIDTVVQPDICVIKDKRKLDDRGCLGAPDLVIEILSPSTSFKDLTDKMKLYEENGVQEYWIINPVIPDVAVYLSDEKRHFSKPAHYTTPEDIKSVAVPGLTVNLETVFSS